eukprot:10989980-Lingulodinium_polyedra.AAC.1
MDDLARAAQHGPIVVPTYATPYQAPGVYSLSGIRLLLTARAATSPSAMPSTAQSSSLPMPPVEPTEEHAHMSVASVAAAD